MDYLDLVPLIQGAADRDVCAYIKDNKSDVQDALKGAGAVLLRGFASGSEETCANALRLLSPELLEDAFWSTPRAGVSGKTFTATEYPGARTISLHSEMAYMSTFPRLLAFHSIVVADEGGETTLGDLERISSALSDVLENFEAGVTYRRNYHPGVDIPWQKAFRTSDPGEAESVAKKAKMKLTWREGDSMQTIHTAQGTIKTEDGRSLWFNQSHVFHSSNLSDKDRAALTELFGADGLPREATFANGDAIAPEMIAHVQRVLEEHTVGVKWQPGDLLFIDNMKVMHGRWPYAGSRKLHVAMAQAHASPVRTPLFEKKGLGQRLWARLAG